MGTWSARWRWLSLAATGACVLLGGLAGTAGAALSLDNTTDTSITIDGDVHWFHGVQQPYTFGGYQYIAYWDAPDATTGEVYLKITRRRLSDNNLVSLRFDQSGDDLEYLESSGVNDGHNGVGFGLSTNDGRIHISWSLHNNDRRHRYLVSEPGCISQSQANFTLANCRFRRSFFQANSTAENSMTYPNYFNDNEGRLYFTWRYDAAARGDQYLNSYDDDGTWTHRGLVFRGRNDATRFTFDPDGAGPSGNVTTTERGIYPFQWEYDKRGRLHVLWMWRENTRVVFGAHGVYYAYSDDEGFTWYSNDGDLVGTSGTGDVITISDQAETQVWSSPPGYHILNTNFELDSNNQPHVVTPESDLQTTDGELVRSRQTHFWRTSNGAWYAEYVQPSGDATSHPSVGDLMFDRLDDAYAVFSRDDLGWNAVNADPYVQAQLPGANVTWQSGRYLDVQLASTSTCIETNDRINVAVSTGGNNQVRVRMRNNTSSRDVTLYWRTDASTGYDAAKSQTFTGGVVANDGSYRDYTFTVTDADWTGTLRGLKLCLAEGVSSGSVSVDQIRVTNSGGTSAKTWDFSSGNRLYAAESDPSNNWASWNIEELLPGESIQRDEGWWRFDRDRYYRSRVVNFVTLVQGAPGTESLVLREFDILGDDTIKYWTFDADEMGWRAANHVSGFGWANDGGTKGVTGRLTGSNSQLLSQDYLALPIGASDNYVHVTMKNSSAATTAALYFTTDASTSFDSTKRKQFTIRANSGYSTYVVDMSTVTGWNNEMLKQLRLEPADDATTTGTFNIDKIVIKNTR